MGLALKIRDLNEDTLATSCARTKSCSGCDPDIPGHVNRATCTICRGSGREPTSFQAAFAELMASRQEAVRDPTGRGQRYSGDVEYFDGEDEIQDLEY